MSDLETRLARALRKADGPRVHWEPPHSTGLSLCGRHGQHADTTPDVGKVTCRVCLSMIETSERPKGWDKR